ncbi:reverse transcriptase [Caerostris extrusa]|uniref:Reverse transcriptase n=1 Tax=Caerostris extrusa TaxID=172846 RepID=A0AAV4URP9_CAEEX|nr:reverse transcriptase [Caerostris extrusa]
MNEGRSFPTAPPILRINFYMEDVLCGTSTLEDAKALQYQFLDILQKLGMKLHKLKVDPSSSYIRRNILSTIARFFNYLGLPCHVVAKAKMFISRLGSLKNNWSDPLPSEENNEWPQFMAGLTSIGKLNTETKIIVEEDTMV